MRRSTLLLASTIGFGVLYLAGTLALGTPPESGDDGPTVAAWFRDNASHVRWWAWCGTLAVTLFAVFAVLVRERLPELHGRLFLFGAISFGAQTLVQSWIWLGLARHAGALDPGTARTVLDVATYWGPVLTGTTILALGPVAVLGLRGEAGIPRWLGVLSGVAFVEQLAETVTIFGTTGFTAPGGPMNLFLGAGLTAVSWLSLGVVLARSAPGAAGGA